jgi:integrase
MPRTAGISTPKYRKHRATGQAIVTIAGRDHYLGPHGTKASRIEYDRIVAEWLAAGRPTSPTSAMDITVAELLRRFKAFADRHYVKDGRPSGEITNLKYALKPVRELYANTLAGDFGPLALKAIQQRFIDAGKCRTQINLAVGKIKRVFKWAVSEQLIAPSVFQALQAVSGLRYGRTGAAERAPVPPVLDSVVEATLPYVPPVVADMVRFQRLTGCRPGEVCLLRPCDVNTDGDVWTYRPSSHKTQHHGRERFVFIGPQAQDILRPYLLRDKESLCFQPSDSERKRLAAVHEARKTPMSCGNRPGSNRKRAPKRKPGQRYDRHSYRHAIVRAVDRANKARAKEAEEAGIDKSTIELVPRWHVNQLRHTAAPKLRAKFGLDAARTVLGHADPKITLTYAEADLAKAAQCMKEVG